MGVEEKLEIRESGRNKQEMRASEKVETRESETRNKRENKKQKRYIN